jgi:hypothetical protein
MGDNIMVRFANIQGKKPVGDWLLLNLTAGKIRL